MVSASSIGTIKQSDAEARQGGKGAGGFWAGALRDPSPRIGREGGSEPEPATSGFCPTPWARSPATVPRIGRSLAQLGAACLRPAASGRAPGLQGAVRPVAGSHGPPTVSVRTDRAIAAADAVGPSSPHGPEVTAPVLNAERAAVPDEAAVVVRAGRAGVAGRPVAGSGRGFGPVDEAVVAPDAPAARAGNGSAVQVHYIGVPATRAQIWAL